MTAPIISREELLREAEEHLGFLSNLPGVHPHRIARIREALIAPAQGAVNLAAHWKERHDTVLQKHIECCGDPAQRPTLPKQEFTNLVERLDFRIQGKTACRITAFEWVRLSAGIADICASHPGLPAPAPHAEVLSGCAVRAAIQMERAETSKWSENDRHFLNAITHRLGQLHDVSDDPRLREQISDEIDWIETQYDAALPQSTERGEVA